MKKPIKPVEKPARGRGSSHNYKLLCEKILKGNVNPYFSNGRRKLYGERLEFRLTPHQLEWLRLEAEEAGLSVSAIVRGLIDREVLRASVPHTGRKSREKDDLSFLKRLAL